MRLLPVAAFALLIAGCSSGSTFSSPEANALVSSVPTVAGNAHSKVKPNVALLWAAGFASGTWINATDHQCGTPSLVGTTFGINLTKSGTSCERDQVQPIQSSCPSCTYFPLVNGRTYEWMWSETDASPSGPPGMGPDTDARSLVWQIHGLGEMDSPCTELGFYNSPSGYVQKWFFTTCNNEWTGSYTPGETDTWRVLAKICSATTTSCSGHTELYRNGTLVFSDNGPNFHSASSTWWNFGPYKWPWGWKKCANPNPPFGECNGSDLKSVNQTFTGMTLQSP